MTKDIKKAIHKEVSLMRLLKHENIVSYLGQEVVSENELHLFLELITKPLDKVVDGIKANERVAFRRSEVLLVAKAVASALKYIHNLPTRLMHRDVKVIIFIYIPRSRIAWQPCIESTIAKELF